MPNTLDAAKTCLALVDEGMLPVEEILALVMIEAMPGKRREQIAAYERLKPLVLEEPGCLQYDLYSDFSDADKFVLVERWASDEALDAHNRSDHMLAASRHNSTFRAGPATFVRLNPASL